MFLVYAYACERANVRTIGYIWRKEANEWVSLCCCLIYLRIIGKRSCVGKNMLTQEEYIYLFPLDPEDF